MGIIKLLLLNQALDFMQLWRNVHRISGRNRSEITT